MNDFGLTSSLGFFSAMALSGFAFGLIYFWLLRRTVDLIAGGRFWLTAAGLSLARIAAAVLLFSLLARLGAWALLAGFAGFLLARAIALRAARSAC